MILSLDESRDDAEKVLTHPEIYKTIAEDDVEDWSLPDGPIYLCGYVPELIGCFVLYKQGRVTLECHVQVLPKYRKEYAEAFGNAVIQWAWDNTEAMKLVAQIPVIYPNVKDFALARGFEIEGINEASYMKGGEIVDQWYLGIKR